MFVYKYISNFLLPFLSKMVANMATKYNGHQIITIAVIAHRQMYVSYYYYVFMDQE